MATMQEIREQALDRARNGSSIRNDAEVIGAFMERGIPLDEIQPRENVLTYRAWQAIGRQVKKGEKGVRLATILEREDDDGEKYRMRRTVSVFHVSQTKVIGEDEGDE